MTARLASYWEIGAPLQQPARDLPRQTDLLIVGAGFLGCWLAYWISRLKPAWAQRTLVIERDLIGYGASTRNAGFLTGGHVSEMLADEAECGFDALFAQFLRRRAGLALVLAEFPDLPTDPCGSADYDEVTEAKRTLARRVNAALAARGEAPAFETKRARFGGTEREVLFSASDRGVNPMQLLTRLRASARAAGVKFAFGVRAQAVSGGRATLALPDRAEPQELAYDRAWICVNAFDSELVSRSPIVPGRGQVLVSSPVKAATSHHLGFLHDGYDYFKFVDGRLLVGGGRHRFRAREQTTELTPTDEVRQYLLGLARTIVGHDRFSIDHAWAGIMGFPQGRHISTCHRTDLDEVTATLNACGGMGVALTPLVARDEALRLP